MSFRKWVLVGILMLVTLLILRAFVQQFKMNRLPSLHIEENRIVDTNGRTIILHGAAIEDPAIEKKWQEQISMEALIDEFAKWHFNFLRIPVHPGQYTKDPDYLVHYVDPIISYANKKGIYVLLGWHAHGNAITGKSQISDGSEEFFNADGERANLFWKEASLRYKDNPGVLYSIFNEPVFITWNEWKPKAEETVQTVRNSDPEKIIFVSGIEWAADLRGAKKNPITGKNIGYEVHVYPKLLQKDWDNYFGFLTKDNVVLVGEWGYDPDASDHLKATTKDFGEPLLKYMEDKGLSWTTWIWSDTWGPPMYKDSSFMPTEFGQLVKDYLSHK